MTTATPDHVMQLTLDIKGEIDEALGVAGPPIGFRVVRYVEDVRR